MNKYLKQTNTKIDMVKFLFGCPLLTSEEEKLQYFLTHTYEKQAKGYRLLFAYYSKNRKYKQLNKQTQNKH